MKKSLTLCLALCACGLGARAQAETGYDLWLRYVPVEDQGQRRAYRRAVPAMVVPGSSPTTRVIRDELGRGLRGLLGGETAAWDEVRGVVGTPSRSPLVAGLGWAEPLARLGDDGYLIRSTRLGGHPAIVIASQGERGALYGVFHFLRLIQTGREVSSLDVAQRPR
ncbi:MAG: alpha-glucuronidase, partial [Acidobacteria bacterium]